LEQKKIVKKTFLGYNFYMNKITKKQERVSLEKINRLTNYFSVAQIFLKNNFFLEEELKSEDIKKRLLGH
jgi:xylulose-5-phosphate/fructose-6-phosphate phosphoketolase